MKKLLAILLVVLTVVTMIPVAAALAQSDAGSSWSNEKSRLRINGVIANDAAISTKPSKDSDSIGKVRRGAAVVVTRAVREEGSGSVWCYFSTVPVVYAKADVLESENVMRKGWTLSENVSLKLNVEAEKVDDPEADGQRVFGSGGTPFKGEENVNEVEATITGMRYDENDVLECYIFVPSQPGCLEGVEEDWYPDGAKSSNIITAIFKIIIQLLK